MSTGDSVFLFKPYPKCVDLQNFVVVFCHVTILETKMCICTSNFIDIG